MIAATKSQLATPQLALAAGALLVSYIVVSVFVYPLFSAQGKFWRSQAWIGHSDEIFSGLRAKFASITNTKEMVTEGYRKYGKKAFVLPQFSGYPLLVLSGQQLHEMLQMPDSLVDPTIPNGDMIMVDRTVGTDLDHTHMDVVKRQLTRRLPLLTTDVFEELRLAMQDQWKATADSWTSVKIYPTSMDIVSRAANRVFAGKELCRVPEFLEHSRLYAVRVFTAGALFKIFPRWMHPIVHPFLQRPINQSQKICRGYSVPIILDRIHNFKTNPKYEPPQDALTWLIEQQLEKEKTNPAELDRNKICRRLLLLNMVAIHTTSITMTNTILDIYTAPRKAEYLASLREECERVLAEYGGVWTKDAVNKLYRIDSALRESLRFQSLGEVNIRRQVVNPKGVDLDGLHIPQGVNVVAAAAAIHLDSDLYPNAREFDPFRFSAPREEYMARVKAAGGSSAISGASDKDDILQAKNQSLIAYGEDFLGFGHGRHACPGRFFASQEMKLMLAHIVMTYDIQIEGDRPANVSIAGSAVPKDEWTMQVRLRKSTV